jgi:hypothetical protein
MTRLLHPTGYQANRGPLRDLVEQKKDGRRVYKFTDAAGFRCYMEEVEDSPDVESELMGLGIGDLTRMGVTLDKDSAYWLGIALISFANSGKLP